MKNIQETEKSPTTIQAQSAIDTDKEIILFDGVCNLCNHSVDFVIARDKKDKFLFASLQSEKGGEIMEQFSIPTKYRDSILLYKNGKIFKKSTAALHIARNLSGLWFLMYGFIIIPAFIRDIVYDFIARNRYRFWGKRDTCRLPSPAERKKFL
jgi:predicted DCC family thiol-disulfide oxidoreductase YuxK